MDLLAKLAKTLNTAKPVTLLTLLLLLHALLHLKYMNMPPVGFHQWRQTQTLSVARNFCEEGMNIFQPRSDNRGQYSGITGMEFPIVNYFIAIGYEVFGVHHWVERTVLLLFSFVGIIGCFYFVRELFHVQWLAFGGAFFLAFSPLYSYYSIVVLPDEPSVAFMIVALFFLQRDMNRRDTVPSLSFLLALTIAALIKVYAFLLLLPAAFYFVYPGKDRSQRAKSAMSLLLSLALVAAWYLYARYLSEVHHNTDFRLESNFPYSPSLIPHILRKVFVQWLPELYINYPAFVFFLLGCVALGRVENKEVRTLLWLYLIPFAVYFVFFLPMFDIHDYYAIPLLPVLVVITVLGLKRIPDHSKTMRWVPGVAVTLLLIVPVVGSVRSLSRFEGAYIDPDLMASEQALDNAIPDRKALVIAAHDDSPSIYLYFMHRKGWHATDAVSASDFRQMIRDGAKYLVSDSRTLEERLDVRDHLTEVSSFGRFKIFRLKD